MTITRKKRSDTEVNFFTILLFLFSLDISFARTTSRDIFVPENSLATNGMTKKRFEDLLNWFHLKYVDRVREAGGELKIIPDWSEPMANAFAQREGETWIIRVLGGMARHRDITEDAFILVLCHEMGHHLGGAPKKYRSRSLSWISSEGQADYYATLKCFRHLFEQEQNENHVNLQEVPKSAIHRCGESFKDKKDFFLCLRTSMAVLSHGKFLGRELPVNQGPTFETPDLTKVKKTFVNHPGPQCRLDTGFAGAICPVDFRQEVSHTDEITGTCHQLNGFTIGQRPSCWFKHKE